MANIGTYNSLEVIKELDFGVYLDADNLGEILLPIKQVPPGVNIGDTLEVFIYTDSEDRLIATTKEPFATINEFAVLRVLSVDKIGAWLDWGLDKHLLVPFREQKQDLEEGKSYLVYVYLDIETQRMVGSTKLDKFLDNVPPDYMEGQEVDLLISNKTEIGYTAIINNLHSGLIYKNEVFQPMIRGEKIKGYIKKVREDEKIDLMLQPTGYDKIGTIAQSILNKVKNAGGELPFGDKTNPEEIYNEFHISKKDFKKAIGQLYKQKLITISPQKIAII